MDFPTTLLSFLVSIATSIRKQVEQCPSEIIPYTAIVNGYTLQSDHSQLVSVFEVDGRYGLTDEAVKTDQMNSLLDSLGIILKDKGCWVQIVTDFEKDSLEKNIKEYVGPLRNRAKAIGFDRADWFMDEVERVLRANWAPSRTFLAVYSMQNHGMTARDMKRHQAAVSKTIKDIHLPGESEGILEAAFSPSIGRSAHISMLTSVCLMANRLNLRMRLMPVRELLQVNSQMLLGDKATLAEAFRLPLIEAAGLNGLSKANQDELERLIEELKKADGIADFCPDRFRADSKYAGSIATNLGYQIAGDTPANDVYGSESAQSIYPELRKVGKRFFATTYVDMMPSRRAEGFEAVRMQIAQGRIPCRVSICLEGGMSDNAARVREMISNAELADLTNLGADEETKQVLGACRVAEKLLDRGVGWVQMTVAITTWGASIDEVQNNLSMLSSSLGAWLTVKTGIEREDVVEGMVGTMPGCASVYRKGVLVPLDFVYSIMPIDRVCAPWRNQSSLLFFFDQYGELYPYSPISSKQQSYSAGLLGGPGSGKSVLLCMMIISAMFEESDSMPLIGGTDFQYSIRGAIRLLQSMTSNQALRDSLEHRTFELSPQFKVNFFETRVLNPFPTTDEQSSIRTALLTIWTNNETGRLEDGAEDVARILLQELYKNYYEIEPKIYQVNPEHEELNAWLSSAGIDIHDCRRSYWDIEFFCFERGREDLMLVAHRYACPNLKDVRQLLVASKDVQTSFKGREQIVSNLTVKLNAFISEYPNFANEGNLTFNSDVTFLDLAKVGQDSSASGVRRVALCAFAARQLICKNFFADAEGDLQREVCNQNRHAEAYWLPKLRSIAGRKKLYFADEVRIVSSIPALADQIVLDQNVGRKSSFAVITAGQFCEHWTPEMDKGLATRFILKAPLGTEMAQLGERMSLDSGQKSAIQSFATGAGGISTGVKLAMSALLKGGGDSIMHGVPFLGGTSALVLLRSVLTPVQISSLASTRRDSIVVSVLRERGYSDQDIAVSISRRYDSGVSSEIEQRIKKALKSGQEIREDENGMSSVAMDVVKEIEECIRLLRMTDDGARGRNR